jgi:hypothetical protein
MPLRAGTIVEMMAEDRTILAIVSPHPRPRGTLP